MEQTGKQDLFEIKLNDSGKLYIRKFAVIARIAIVIGIIISFIHIATTVMWYTNYAPLVDNRDSYFLLEYRFLPYYIVFYCLLFYPQMYLYWQVTKYLRNGLKDINEQTFNKAFRSLFKFSVFGVASLLLSSLFYGFELFVFIKRYLN